MDKSALRTRCCTLRDTMTGEAVAAASASIREHLIAWPIFQRAQTVMAYMAFRNEVNLVPLMEQCPDKCWAIPRILIRPEPRLILHLYDPARLVRHRFGMLEPDASLPVIEPSRLDLVLTPGVAFDRRGYRLGLGGGFYDRLLPCVAAIKVGITYAALIVDHVPTGEFDRRVDFIACETGIITTE